jgi:hypothetical protein
MRGHSPNLHIHVSVSDLYTSTIDLPILLQENMWKYINRLQTLNVEIRTWAAQFPEKEYINGIFVAVFMWWLKLTIYWSLFVQVIALIILNVLMFFWNNKSIIRGSTFTFPDRPLMILQKFSR